MSDETTEPEKKEPIQAPLRIRYRVRFGKTGLLRWIGHTDLAKLWERLGRRAELNFSMTEGFHPKPRIAFPSALALGVESLDEVVEIELAEELTPGELLQRLIADNQPGLTMRSVTRLPEGFGKAQLMLSEYIVTPPENPDWDALGSAIMALKDAGTMTIQRKKKTLTFDVAENLPVVEIGTYNVSDSGAGEASTIDVLKLSLVAAEGASLKPSDVLAALELQDWIENGATITRLATRLKKEFEDTNCDNYAESGHVPTASAIANLT